ncbi:MAG TPA: 3-hydroxyacyl-CoA dehydrogenase NAD-binding domain-containing protein [Thermomicrobiales bacterium]|nr:3-hydroxyacyl-CoA dehydrogenase NAD-binding domain-containing protein [Thermomicrobiales bacterium]
MPAEHHNGVDDDGSERAIRSLGVIGAGTMGSGIAQVAAMAGIEVMLVDQADAWLDQGLKAIADDLDRSVQKERMTGQQRDTILSRITGSTAMADVGDCDLVIEAVNESFATKASVFGAVADVVLPDAIIVSNTSSISITALAGTIPNPGRVAGMHFFNPVQILKLVEVIRGIQTSDATLGRVHALAAAMGKTAIDVTDSPGFVANRLLIPMINEAVFCLAEGVANAGAIDEVMKLGAAHPIGPLALADLIGLDICLDIMETLHSDFGDDKYRPAPLLRQMVSAGRLGRKSGSGFHEYGDQ